MRFIETLIMLPTYLRYLLLPFFLTLFVASSAYADYSKHDQVQPFIDNMVEQHGFAEDELVALLQRAKKQQSILDAISRPAEKTKQWFEYRKIFVQDSRIRQGVEFWQENIATLNAASKAFGVPPEIIVAIIGVETRYGRHAGRYRVLDALATLGFDYPRRSKFFRGELEHFLLLAREQKLDPESLMGSYAGAMGYGQFIPSSYRHYAVDFDQDKTIDIWENPVDAIGSVANYFKEHRWQTGEPVVARARISDNYDSDALNSRSRPKHSLKELKEKGFSLVDASDDQERKGIPLSFVGDHGKEFWIGYTNFYVITRYNRSHMYAMAVWQLSQEILQAYTSAQDIKAKGN